MRKFNFKRFAVFSSLISVGLLSSSVSFAGVVEGQHVSLPAKDITISGPGISADEVANSLTNIPGILSAIQFRGDGNHVSFDGAPEISGDSIKVNLTFHEFINFNMTNSGTLSSATYGGCPAGQIGTQLTLTSSPLQSGEKERVKSTVFQGCIKSVPGGAQLHITSYLVAGHDWASQAVEVANAMFAGLGAAVQKNALAYAGGASGSTAQQTTLASAAQTAGAAE